MLHMALTNRTHATHRSHWAYDAYVTNSLNTCPTLHQHTGHMTQTDSTIALDICCTQATYTQCIVHSYIEHQHYTSATHTANIKHIYVKTIYVPAFFCRHLNIGNPGLRYHSNINCLPVTPRHLSFECHYCCWWPTQGTTRWSVASMWYYPQLGEIL